MEYVFLSAFSYGFSSRASTTFDPDPARRVSLGPPQLVSPELLRISAFLLFGALIGVSIVLTKLFAKLPEETEVRRAFGYDNICIYLDYPPASWVAPTLWVGFLMPWMSYSLAFSARLQAAPIRPSLVRFMRFITYFELFCAAQFIQVFANKPGDLEYPMGLKMHTYPFTLLVVALWIMSCKNVWWFTNYEQENSVRRLKLYAWAFEAVYFVVSVCKVFLHVNFFLDSAFYVGNSPGAIVFGRVSDALFMLCAAVLVPTFAWVMNYRVGDRLEVELRVVKVVDGDFDLRGRPLAPAPQQLK